MRYDYFDFFAGGGMTSFGLGQGWRCRFANDIDPQKAACYRANHAGGAEFVLGDVADLTTADLPGAPDLAPDLVWASFPCQDLSLAGKGAGLRGRRSGMFRPFWSLMRGLAAEGRGPRLIALENVVGAITSNGGRDLATICAAFSGLGYRFGAMVIDAADFLPQSRPRFFLVAVRGDLGLPPALRAEGPLTRLHPPALVRAHGLMSAAARARWVWWRLPGPPAQRLALADLIETAPADAPWRSEAELSALLAMMAPAHRERVAAAQAAGGRAVGAVYRRTRVEAGRKVQRAEIRFDGVAGCLRTPSGGSSRQTLLLVEDGRLRARLLSSREAARLMGLPEDYALPSRYNAAYKLAGDGVAVPVVRHLAETLFEPVLDANRLARVA